MRNRDRVTMTVTVDRDPLPGAFHTALDVRNRVATILNEQIGHYHPVVILVHAPRSSEEAWADLDGEVLE